MKDFLTKNNVAPAIDEARLTEVFNQSMSRLEHSLAVFADINATIDQPSIISKYLNPFKPASTDNTPHYLFVSEIHGAIPGNSYLMINAKSANSLMPENFINDCEPSIMLEFLKEMDNVLTASLITVLANELEIFSYGAPPSVNKMTIGDARKWIHQDILRQERDHAMPDQITIDLQIQIKGRQINQMSFIWSLFGNFQPSNASNRITNNIDVAGE